MAKDGGPDWNGLLKWSLAHGDGTNPPRALSEEDRKWFMEAMQANTIDVVQRMKEITQVMKTPEDVLESQGVTPENIEDMLDELQEHVESIDMANDLHSIGGLDPLLGYLKNSHAGIRAKAAEVVSTIVQNNPKSQQLVMESNGLEPLLTNFKSDPSTNARTKALGAISSLIRHNQPGISAFRLGNGYAGLKDALGSDDARLQRCKVSQMRAEEKRGVERMPKKKGFISIPQRQFPCRYWHIILVDHNWTRGLWRMNTVDEMVAFVQLWVLVQDKQFTNQEDQIRWKWRDNAAYTSKWAYLVQLHGTTAPLREEVFGTLMPHAEGKINLFAWLLVQSKILTADKMAAKHWDCNQTCPLCDQEPEAALHLCLHCSYSKEVWQLMSRWTAEQVLVPEGDETDMEAKLGGPRC